MNRTMLLRASSIALLVSLGGCQFLGKFSLTRSGSTEQQQVDKAQRAAPASLAEGREHLRANRNGMAIDAFNLALVRGEDPAAAYNGLGVAYARVGRNDLAYRFFKKANVSDPDNPVYAANLIRLVDSPAFALNQIDRAPAAPTAVTERPVTASTAAASPRVPGKLHREGRGQISLVTRPDAGALVPDQRRAGLAQVAVRPAMAPAAVATTAEPAATDVDEPAAAPPSGKRKMIEFGPAPTKSGQVQSARRNPAS